MIFVETPTFTKRVLRLLDDESYAALQTHLAKHPDDGNVIRGGGGLRKIRWAGKGHGKRRCAGDLLLVDRQGSDFDAVHLSEK